MEVTENVISDFNVCFHLTDFLEGELDICIQFDHTKLGAYIGSWTDVILCHTSLSAPSPNPFWKKRVMGWYVCSSMSGK